jgi:hypothetical protein
MEKWTQIETYPNYSVSNIGEIRNDKTGRILKKTIADCGYYRVGLFPNNKKIFIHTLIAKYFVPNPNPTEYTKIDHIDRNKLNNSVDNLRWCNNEINNANRCKAKNIKSSKYKGVHWRKDRNCWNVEIHINKKCIHIGSFKDENEAGESYNKYILEHHLEEYYTLNEIVK